MLDRLFNARIHNFLHLLGLIGIAVGLSFGKAFMSLSMVLLIANFLLEANFKVAIQRIRENRLLLTVLCFYTLLLIGLSWSSDFSIGLKEIKSRLPLLAIPLIVGARETLSKKQIQLILHFFLISLFVTSLINFLSYNGLIGNRLYDDIRGMSLFGSHIRYGIVIALGTAFCIYQQIQAKKILWMYFCAATWFVFYTYFSEILTGALSMIMVFIATAVYLIWTWKKSLAIVTLFLFVGTAIYFSLQFTNISIQKADISSLPESTANGNYYYHTNEAFSEINGLPLYTFYCEKEMISEWNKVSSFHFMGDDLNEHLLRNTAVRYMTAMELTKDSVGFQQLSDSDIRAIENGFTYPGQQNDHFFSRINGIRYQLMNKTNPNGHSLLQRFEYWKASIHVIKKHWLIGVGTGGNQRALDEAYVELNSKLLPKNRCRSHNMFMSYFISYGVLGFIAFLFLVGLILYSSLKNHYLLGIQFIAILAASFLIEDTLETQMGVTIFGFFLALVINEMNLNRRVKLKSNS